MSNEDLLKMLDLAGKEAPAEVKGLAVTPGEAVKNNSLGTAQLADMGPRC